MWYWHGIVFLVGGSISTELVVARIKLAEVGLITDMATLNVDFMLGDANKQPCWDAKLNEAEVWKVYAADVFP